MKQIIKYIIFLYFLVPLQMQAQSISPVVSLDTILSRIDRNNILLQSYALKAESYKYSADASTAWMAPMVGIGTFMTPYPGQKNIEARDKGNIMLQIEQDIPNHAKVIAKRKFIESQANVEETNRDIKLNELKAQAKRIYYNWIISKFKIRVLQQNERIMVTMKKIEEVRYPYNQSQLSNVYLADARIEDNRNMIIMQEGIIAKARAWLNSLMNEEGNRQFEIDSITEPHFAPADIHDTANLATIRKDILQMNQSIRSMQLNIESMKHEKKPDFRIRIDHMNPLSGMMPKAYNVMGMISIPIVPWSSKKYKSEIRAMQFDILSKEKERAGMLQQTQGMLYGMQYEIQSMHYRVMGMEEKIIPSLQKAMDANYESYKENKLALPVLIDSWEALNMMYMNLLDEKLKHYEMIIEYEKELYR